MTNIPPLLSRSLASPSSVCSRYSATEEVYKTSTDEGHVFDPHWCRHSQPLNTANTLLDRGQCNSIDLSVNAVHYKYIILIYSFSCRGRMRSGHFSENAIWSIYISHTEHGQHHHHILQEKILTPIKYWIVGLKSSSVFSAFLFCKFWSFHKVSFRYFWSYQL